MYLGIDLGTSEVKVLLLASDGSVVGTAGTPFTVSRPKPRWSEQNPLDWWNGTRAALFALRDKFPREFAQVRGIGLSGQMHGAVLLDSEDQVLRPAILWNDMRSDKECDELTERASELHQIAGNLAMPGFTAPKLLWVQHNEPEIFNRTACVLLPKDYLRLHLTGTKVSDPSDAAGTLWLDVARRDWSDELLAACNMTRAQMPALAEGSEPSGTLLPALARELGLRDGVVVAAGGGDNAASAVGLGVVSPGQAFLSLGTSGVLFVVTDSFRPNPDRAAHAFCHCLPNTWHQMSVMLSAASVLDWVAQLTGEHDLPRLVERAKARGVSRQSPVFLPYLSGERTPHNDPNARGVFFGIRADTDAADLTVAVLEGVALAFADGLDVLLEKGGSVGEVSVTGGGARLPYWGELLAAALDRPLTYRVGGEVGAALGAARLAHLALGGASAQDVCLAPPVGRVVEPDASLVSLLATRRRTFVRLYQDLKNTFVEYSA